MNTKELMLGDFVNYRTGWINEETGKPEYECEGMFPIKVCFITPDAVQYEEEMPDGSIETIEAIEYELFPTPITPEILEKNGLRKLVTYGTEKWTCDNFRLNVYSSDGTWRFCADTKRNEDSVIYVRFVHQLQHALRLCGLNELADNFKV